MLIVNDNYIIALTSRKGANSLIRSLIIKIQI